jgi:hypothetical protein
MTKTTNVLTLLAGICLAAAPEARAQTENPQVFVIVNVGAQAHTHTVSTGGSFTAFEETGTFASRQGVSGGLLFDLGAGYQVTDKIAIAVSASRVAEATTASVTADVPHPIFFDRLRPASVETEGLDRREVGVHIQLMYFLNAGFLPEGSRLAFTVGPSFFRVEHDLVTDVDVLPTPPAANPAIDSVVEKQSASGVGFNAGFDFTYPIASRIGIGAFVRYAGASGVSPIFDAFEGSDSAGGFQGGAGLRIGF